MEDLRYDELLGLDVPFLGELITWESQSGGEGDGGADPGPDNNLSGGTGQRELSR